MYKVCENDNVEHKGIEYKSLEITKPRINTQTHQYIREESTQ